MDQNRGGGRGRGGQFGRGRGNARGRGVDRGRGGFRGGGGEADQQSASGNVQNAPSSAPRGRGQDNSRGRGRGAARGGKKVDAVKQLAEQLEQSMQFTEGAYAKGLVPPTLREKEMYPGTEGKKVVVEVNHFKNTSKVKPIHQYSIDIFPPWERAYSKKDQDIYRKVFQEWTRLSSKLKIFWNPKTKKNPSFAFNGKNVFYSTQLIQDIPDYENIEVIGDNTRLIFQIKNAKYVNTLFVTEEFEKFLEHGRRAYKTEVGFAHDMLSAIDVILSQTVRLDDVNFRTIGRSFYPVNGEVLDLGFGKEVWYGTFLSARPHGWKKDGGYLFTMNADVANKPAVVNRHFTNGQDCYLNLMFKKSDLRSGLEYRDTRTLHEDLKGLKIRYELPDGKKRAYRVNGLVKPASEQIIPDLKITVEQYFKTEMKILLKLPKLPCLHVGAVNKTIYIPMEFCEMLPQSLPRGKKLSDICTATMIRKTAVAPQERKKKIMAGLRESGNLFMNDEFAIEFGISFEQRMMQITGRVLDAPSIGYKNQAKCHIDPKEPGVWRPRNLEYRDGKSLKKWIFMDFKIISEKQFNDLLIAFRKMGSEVGLKIESNPEWFPTNEREFVAHFEKIVQQKQPQMIMILLPFKTGNLYDKIKQLGDIEHKVPTQCVKFETLFKKDQMVNVQSVSNLFLKMNSKLGGINHCLAAESRPDILKKPIMIMGADVSHAAPEQRGFKPSLAAVVGSINPSATQYATQIRVQMTANAQTEEIITDMKEITRKLLMEFYKRTKHKPAKIIMFRDGVSEGQFLKVLSTELQAMRQACKVLADDFEPDITYVVVQKRHHTRFFPTDENKYPKNGNVLAGTVVDQGISHPKEGDFFLVSHEGIQGTSRPTHYHVLWDDCNMSADQMEKLTYYLCHLYSRCNRSVSYPAPTYYAHLAADRARKHHNDLLEKRERDIKKKIEESDIELMYFV